MSKESGFLLMEGKMKKIILIFGLIIVLFLSCAAQRRYNNDNFIAGWELEFWQLNPLQGDYLIVFPGDTLMIRFDQILKTIPLNKQMNWGIGDTTGVVYSIFIPKNQFQKTKINDTLFTYYRTYKIKLNVGSYSFIMRTKGTNGKWSKHSKAYWFNIVNIPPYMPVEIKLLVKP